MPIRRRGSAAIRKTGLRALVQNTGQAGRLRPTAGNWLLESKRTQKGNAQLGPTGLRQEGGPSPCGQLTLTSTLEGPGGHRA